MITGPLSLNKLNKKGEKDFKFNGLVNEYKVYNILKIIVIDE